jgi:hypothetical protein
MKKIINCKICLEDKDTTIILEHINPTGDVSEHQMCEDCYKIMTKNKCPFCRCEIILPKPILNAIDIDATQMPPLLTPEQLRTREQIINVVYDRTRTYDLNRIAAGLAWPDGSPIRYSN